MILLLLVIALLAFQLAAAVPQQTPSPTTPQPSTPTLSLTPTPSLVSLTSASFATAGWPTMPVSTVVTALPDMDQPWAVRILLKPTSSTSNSSGDDLSNAMLLADSQTSNKLAVARWNRDGLSDAQRNSPVRNATYFLNQPLSGLPAQPGMIGLAAIYTNTTTLDMYTNVRRALGFAQKNEFTHLLLYADNSTSVKEFDFPPAEESVPNGPEGVPYPPLNRTNSPLSPYRGSAKNVPPTYQYMFPFLDGVDLDALKLFRLAFEDSNFTPVSVIVLEHNTGRRLASFLSSNERAKIVIQDGEIDYILNRPTDEKYPLKSSIIAIVAALCTLVVIVIIIRVVYVRILRGYVPLTQKEEWAIVAAVQHALELRYQSVLERRARIRATMPKPIKPNLGDITTVVLDKFNMGPTLAHSATTVLPLSTAPATTKYLEKDIDGDPDTDSNIDGYDDEGHASPLAHARHLVRRNADTDTEPSHPLQSAASHESCSICIDEFAAGDTVRVLPACHHVFHADCIDPWLTTTSALCPLCKSDTRSAAELDEYNAQLALAKLSETSPDTQIRDISVEMLEFFEQVVDDISVARLGHIIKQTRPVTIIANYDHTARIACEFTTTHFIRDTLSIDDGRSGWLARFVKRYRQNHPQVPLKLDVVVQRPPRSANPNNRTTTYPPAQHPSTEPVR